MKAKPEFSDLQPCVALGEYYFHAWRFPNESHRESKEQLGQMGTRCVCGPLAHRSNMHKFDFRTVDYFAMVHSAIHTERSN